MIRRRAGAAGIKTQVGNHTFRATGITAYLKNGGSLENAAAMANHASTRTTQLYDRRRDEVNRCVIKGCGRQRQGKPGSSAGSMWWPPDQGRPLPDDHKQRGSGRFPGAEGRQACRHRRIRVRNALTRVVAVQKRYTMLFARRKYRCWTPREYIAVDRDAEVGMRWHEVRLRLHNVVRGHGTHVVQRGAGGKAPKRCDGLVAARAGRISPLAPGWKKIADDYAAGGIIILTADG